MSYTITQAAKAVQKDKTTLLRAIRAGKVSAVRDAVTGNWLIEPAELHRVYSVTTDSVADAVSRSGDFQPRSDSAEVENRELRARLADKDAQITDLQRRLDTEAAERRQAIERLLAAQEKIAVLTDQRPPARRSWWRWR
jgi:chromosome segregation ATPase